MRIDYFVFFTMYSKYDTRNIVHLVGTTLISPQSFPFFDTNAASKSIIVLSNPILLLVLQGIIHCVLLYDYRSSDGIFPVGFLSLCPIYSYASDGFCRNRWKNRTSSFYFRGVYYFSPLVRREVFYTATQCPQNVLFKHGKWIFDDFSSEPHHVTILGRVKVLYGHFIWSLGIILCTYVLKINYDYLISDKPRENIYFYPGECHCRSTSRYFY